MNKIKPFKDHKEDLKETQITSRQMPVNSMGRRLRKLNQLIQRERDVSKQIVILAEIVLYATQILDKENTSIFQKCTDDGKKVET